jgi:hypothetical protein
MIRHCVFIKFRADIAETEKQAIFDDIRALQALLPGFLAVHIGDNVSPETGMDKGFSAGLIADFKDAAARDAYLVHPAHQKAGGRIVAAAKGGVEGIFVYDIEVAA